MMYIAKKEFFKIIENPVLWILMGCFLLINCLILYSNIGDQFARPKVREMYGAVRGHGHDEEAEEFLSRYREKNASVYDGLDMMEIFKNKENDKTTGYHLTGKYREHVRQNYEKLQLRLEQIKKSGENRRDFYPGESYHIFYNMFGLTGKMLLAEMTIFIMLSLLFLMDYERMKKTREILAVTHTGKRVMKTKIFVGVFVGLMFSILLMIVTYLFFFHLVPMSDLWNVPVSSDMVSEVMGFTGSFPFVTFWKMSMGDYFLLSMAVMLGLLLAVAGFCVAVWLLIQNSYLAFLVQGGWGLVLYYLVYAEAWNLVAVLKTVFNPVVLWEKCGTWFMENDLILSFQGSEFVCVACSVLTAFTLAAVGSVRYRRMEIR